MQKIDPAQLSERENYKFLTGSIIPRPVAFVTTISGTGILNAAPFSYFNIVSSNPPMISLSIQRQDGKMKDTARNAEAKSAFVIHISDESYVEEINKTAKPLAPEESEISLTRLTPISSEKIDVPAIQEAKIRLECVLEQKITLGQTEKGPSCDLLIGRIVQYHIREELYEHGRIDAKGLAPVSRLAGNSYATLGKLFELERPT